MYEFEHIDVSETRAEQPDPDWVDERFYDEGRYDY
jgi:hypothetical protein